MQYRARTSWDTKLRNNQQRIGFQRKITLNMIIACRKSDSDKKYERVMARRCISVQECSFFRQILKVRYEPG